MLPRSIQNLIDQFAKLPSVGPRQAARFVFYLIKQPKKELDEFAKAVLGISKNLGNCSLCFRFVEAGNICDVCKNMKRDNSTICIVEKDTDIEAIEKTGRYNGLYHVLGNNGIKDFGEKNIQELHLKELIERIKKIQPTAGHPQGEKKIKEIIIATSATTEGDTLALYISRLFKPLGIKITRLGRGLSTGSELEYMDEETLTNALLGRK